MSLAARTEIPGSAGLGRFEMDGFQIIPAVAGSEEMEMLLGELAPLLAQHQVAGHGKIGGVRNLLRISPGVAAFARSAKVLSLVSGFAGHPMFPVRAICFDKNPAANWLVPWHQDLAIAVAGRTEIPGFAGWSVKDGVPHVHPPCEILEEMVTLRLHLDDCAAHNGALQVLPGSHRQGKLDAAGISGLVSAQPAVVCEVARGDVLLMRPLLLHSSRPAENPAHRRVLHVEFAGRELPDELTWFDA